MTSDIPILSSIKRMEKTRTTSVEVLTASRSLGCSFSIANKPFWTLVLTMWIFFLFFKPVYSGELSSYCQYEHFEASCKSDEVILMVQARYGRMKMGRCVKKDYGLIGCFDHVLSIMDGLCSGKRHCNVEVRDPIFVVGKPPCNNELKLYLEAQYTCVKVFQPTLHQCHSSGHVSIPKTPGYLSSVVTQETQCGSDETPYLIRLNEGQRVNVTLIDFGLEDNKSGSGSASRGFTNQAKSLGVRGDLLSSRDLSLGRGASAGSSHGGCIRYATIQEPLTDRRVNLCSRGRRVTQIFLSETNIIEISVGRTDPGSSPNNFLLHYEAVGCANMEPEQDMWIERKGDNINIGCNGTNTEPIWHLTCQKNSWIGSIGNCSREASNYGELVFDVISLPTGLLIAIVIGIAFSISLVILLLGVSYLRRKTHHRRQQLKQNNLMDMLDDPQLRVPDVYGRDGYAREDCSLYEQRHACVYSPATGDGGACTGADIAYLWDSTPGSNTRMTAGTGTLRSTGSKLAEKLYATGTYAPLPCKCPAIKLKELRSSPGSCAITGGDGTAPGGGVLGAPQVSASIQNCSNRGIVLASSNTGVQSTVNSSVNSSDPPRVSCYKYDYFDPDVIRANTINAKKSRVMPSGDVTETLCRSRDGALVTNGSDTTDCAPSN